MMLSLRECSIKDLDLMVEVSKTTFKEAFEKDNDPEDFANYLRKAFHPKQLSKEIKNKDSHFYFVYEQDVLVGYVKLNEASAQTDVHHPKALEIERIYVLGKYQGKRIGTRLLHQIKAMAKNLGKEFIWLGVWEHNPRAIKLYQRHGFEKFGEHPYYIGSDKQTDWLLRLYLE